MKPGAPASFGRQLKALREEAGFTQEELATIAGLSVHAVSALERGERRRPHVDTVRALSAALDLTGSTRDAFLARARAPLHATALDEWSGPSLPVPPTALLGRDADLETLQRWLEDPAARLITLVGPGGVGKTRLALELAHAMAGQSSNRVLFVPLAPLDDAALAAAAIAEALGLADITGHELPSRVRVACGTQTTMIVLDNFEQLLDATPMVAELLASVAVLRLLVTSRAPLRVRGERQYAVGPLALTHTARSPADLAHAPAVRLFLERIRDVQPDFRLTDENAPTVTAICRRLDALPLALELAARWIKVMPAENLLHRLEHDALLLADGPRDLPGRQQTMNATVAWSYQLLNPDEQRAFRRLGTLPGPFAIEVAEAVLAGGEGRSRDPDAALHTTAGLIDKSLLVRDEPAGVVPRPAFYMLETVRAYAVRELAASNERDDAMEGLVRYCIADASHASQGLIGSTQVEWLDRVRRDIENYRVALSWLLVRGRVAEASDIAWGLMFFWLIRGYTAEGLEWYEATLRTSSLAPVGEAQARLGAGLMRYVRGEHERARTEVTRALTLAVAAGNVDIVAQAEHLLGHVDYAVGAMSAARVRFARTIDLVRTVPSSWIRGQALSGMAEVAFASGGMDEAERLLDEAAPALEDVGPWFQSLSSYVRILLALRRGNPHRALLLARDSLTRIRALHDRFAFVYMLVPLAAAAVIKGDYALGTRVLGARDAVIERTGVTLVDLRARDLHDHAEREARARLGAARWAQAYAAGRRTSIDALLRDIDRATEPVST
jgi:predicted ATPase/DNA-binding XRE family transcriptional regulator